MVLTYILKIRTVLKGEIMNKVLCFIFIIINSIFLVGCNSSSKLDKNEDAYGTYIYIGYYATKDNNNNTFYFNKEINLDVFTGDYSQEKYEFAVMLKEAVGDQIILTKDYLEFAGAYDLEIPYENFHIGFSESAIEIDQFSLPEQYKIQEIVIIPQYERQTIIWYDIIVRASIHFSEEEEYIDLELKLDYRKEF